MDSAEAPRFMRVRGVAPPAPRGWLRTAGRFHVAVPVSESDQQNKRRKREKPIVHTPYGEVTNACDQSLVDPTWHAAAPVWGVLRRVCGLRALAAAQELRA